MFGRLRNYWSSRNGSSSESATSRKPLPKVIVFSCVCALFPSAFILTMLFPFLPWMVKRFTVGGEQITNVNSGPYVGLVASSVFIGSTFGSYFWGWLSDVRGRRPAMLSSLFFLALGNFMFGFTNGTLGLGWAVASRFLCGVFNGIVVITKALLAEVSDDSNQAQGVTVVTSSWGLGLIIGPAVGGYFAEPARQYPSTLGDSEFLKEFPYILPTLVGTFFCIVGFFVVLKFLPETLESKRTYNKLHTGESAHSADTVSNGNSKGHSNGHSNGLDTPKWNVSYSASRGRSSIFASPSASVEVSGADRAPARASSSQDSLSVRINHGATQLYSEEDDTASRGDADVFAPAADVRMVNGTSPVSSPLISGSSTEANTSVLMRVQGTATGQAHGEDAGEDGVDDEEDDPGVILPPPGHLSWACWRALLRFRIIREFDRSKLMFLFRRSLTRNSILLYSVFSLGHIGLDEIFSLWCSEPPHLGGLGLGLSTIGTTLAIVGGVQLPVQIFIVPKLERRLGARRCYLVMSLPLILTTIMMPSLTYMAHSSAVVPLLVLVVLLNKSCALACFVCLIMLINNSVESKDLGAANGLAMTSTAAFRSAAPLLCGSIFSWSIADRPFPFDHHLVFFLVALLFLCTACVSTRMELRDKKPET